MNRVALLAATSLLCAGAVYGADTMPTDQSGAEKSFDAQINPAEMGGWMKRLASEPNHVGSPHDKANAEWMLAQFKAWGWDAHIETFEVLYPTPIREALELLGAEAVQGDAAGAADHGRHQRDRERARAARLSRLSGRRRRHRRRSSMSITA